MISKNDFRQKIKLLRNNFDADYISVVSQKITKNILQWDNYILAKNIMIFYPLKKEISLLSLLNNSDKTFYFPIVDGDNLFVGQYNQNLGFKKGLYNINEPIGNFIEDISTLDMVFAPALAADTYGYRMGYGKGYYDRFFENISKKTIKVIPVFSDFFYESIPSNSFDKKCDYIITEKSIFKIKNH